MQASEQCGHANAINEAVTGWRPLAESHCTALNSLGFALPATRLNSKGVELAPVAKPQLSLEADCKARECHVGAISLNSRKLLGVAEMLPAKVPRKILSQ